MDKNSNRFKLHYAEMPLGETIQVIDSDHFDDLVEFVRIVMGQKVMDRVYLYKYGGLENPIIISCNPYHIYQKFYNDFGFPLNNGFREHHIHEYESYAEAYKVATDMMEEHHLCYSRWSDKN